MIVERKSPRTGAVNRMDLDVTPEQLAAIERKEGLIQNIVPHLNADEREFLLTGYTAEDWDAMFPPSCDSCLRSTVGDDEVLRCGYEAAAEYGKEVADDHKCQHWKAG